MDHQDVWAIHALAHVYEMRGEIEKGKAFLYQTKSSWEKSLLQQHIAWHLTLFLLETQEIQSSLSIYKHFIIPDAS